jgi:hypothetical protein
MPRWQIFDNDWPASALCMVPVGDTIEGSVDVDGNLVKLTWNGALLPLASPAVPLNACACDQDAADILSRSFPEALYRLRATPPAIIRPLINVG